MFVLSSAPALATGGTGAACLKSAEVVQEVEYLNWQEVIVPGFATRELTAGQGVHPGYIKVTEENAKPNTLSGYWAGWQFAPVSQTVLIWNGAVITLADITYEEYGGGYPPHAHGNSMLALGPGMCR